MNLFARYAISLLLAAAWAYGAASNIPEEPATCETDTDCEVQCRADLQPDEDESICDVEA